MLGNLAVIGQSASPEFAAPVRSRALRVRAQTTSERPTEPTLSIYDGGAQTRRTVGWRAPTTFPNDLLNSLTTVRDRSRAAARNDGYAKGTINKIVSNVVGTGIKPLSQAEDLELRKQIHALWFKWTDESDADGLLPFEGQQAQAVRTWLVAGECFIRLRDRRAEDGLSVPLQIQVIEPELCPHLYSAIKTNGTVRAGIQRNAIGKRTAYWFYRQRPDSLNDVDATNLVPVSADQIIHLYDPTRPGQLRGLPHLTPALVSLHELDKFDDATLLRQQLANLFVAFVKREAPTTDPIIDPLTGLPSEAFEDKPFAAMEPGTIQELAPGEDLTFSDPPEIRQGYADFMRQQLLRIAAAADVPYELITGDMSRVNDRTVRVILNEFRRWLQGVQHQIVSFQLLRRVWMAWMDRAWISAALPIPDAYATNPGPWIGVKWMPQRWQYIHPVQDVQAAKDEIRNGFTSRSSVVSERGEDAEVIDAETKADNDRVAAMGLPPYDSECADNKASPEVVGAGA
jgi:lambda family phage portal protein